MKKFVCILLAVLMLVPLANTAFANPVEPSGKSFIDVPRGAWYESAVDYCTDKGYFNGTSTDRFSPTLELTREQFTTVLFNFAGYSSDNWQGKTGYADTETNSWYAPSVKWARILGVTSGAGNGCFGVGMAITREQFCTLLMNYAGSLGMDISGRAYIFGNIDANQISSWAIDGMSWAVYEGIMTGTSGNTLSPKGITTRAEAVMLIKNFDSIVIKSGVCKHIFEFSGFTDANCTQSGSVKCRCTKCPVAKTLTIAPIGHNIYNGVCSVCDYCAYPPSPVGTYYLKGIDYDDGTYVSYVDYSVYVVYYSDGAFAFHGFGETAWGDWYFDEYDGYAYYNIYEQGIKSLRTCLEVFDETIYISNNDGSWLFFQPY